MLYWRYQRWFLNAVFLFLGAAVLAAVTLAVSAAQTDAGDRPRWAAGEPTPAWAFSIALLAIGLLRQFCLSGAALFCLLGAVRFGFELGLEFIKTRAAYPATPIPPAPSQTLPR